MTPVILGLLCFVAGFVALLPDFFAAFLRESAVIVLFVLAVVGVVSFVLLSLLRPALAAELQRRVRT